VSPTRSLSLRDLADAIGASLIGDADRVVDRVEEPADATAGALTFVSNPRRSKDIFSTKAEAVIADFDFAAEQAHEVPCAVLACENRYLAFAQALQLLYGTLDKEPVVDERAAVSSDACLGERVSVGPFAVVGKAVIGDDSKVGAHVFIDDDVVIGERCVLQPGVVLLHGTRLGDDIYVNPGAVLGGEGFGFAPDGDLNIKVPQVGGVVVDNHVDIGANVCLDRGAVSDTVIGEGTKIDNLVQVGHGVKVGDHAVLIAQVGIGGDTVVGDHALLAGQVGVVHNVTIGRGARIGAQSGITRDVPEQAAWSGYPAYPHAQWLKTSVHNRHLDDKLKKLTRIEREHKARIEQLEAELAALRDLVRGGREEP